MRAPGLPPQAPGSCRDVQLPSPGCLMPLGVPGDSTGAQAGTLHPPGNGPRAGQVLGTVTLS